MGRQQTQKYNNCKHEASDLYSKQNLNISNFTFPKTKPFIQFIVIFISQQKVYLSAILLENYDIKKKKKILHCYLLKSLRKTYLHIHGVASTKTPNDMPRSNCLQSLNTPYHLKFLFSFSKEFLKFLFKCKNEMIRRNNLHHKLRKHLSPTAHCRIQTICRSLRNQIWQCRLAN